MDSHTDIVPLGETKREVALNTAGATKKVAYEKVVSKLDAKSLTVDKFGDEHISDDNTTQLRAAELILRLHNDIKPDGSVTNTVVHTTINVTGAEMQGYIEEARRLRVLDSKQQTGEIIDIVKYAG